jgi:hypothetical protein
VAARSAAAYPQGFAMQAIERPLAQAIHAGAGPAGSQTRCVLGLFQPANPSGMPKAASGAVMAPMSTKSREVIYGGQVIGAKIRAEDVREAAEMAVREADRAASAYGRIQMEAYGGPARPSPTIAQCLNGGK